MSMSPILRAQAAAARVVLDLPAPLLGRLAGEPITRDGYTLDPQIQLMLRMYRLLGRDRPARSIAEARRGLEESAQALAPSGGPLRRVEDTRVGQLRARVYVPHGVSSPAPALVYFHGGGWSLGSIDSHDAPARIVAAEASVVVISIEYRLAPEHPFPAGVEDAIAAFRTIAANPARHGVDPARLAVGGDSAGGNLAAVVAHATRGDAIRPAFQWLVYPGVDMTMTQPSVESCGRGFYLEKPAMVDHIRTYLGDGDRRDPRASPLFSPSFAGLPPAFVGTAGFDPLRDEGAAYARALEAGGTRTVYKCYGGLVHGFLNIGGGIRAARAALSDMARELASGLGTSR